MDIWNSAAGMLRVELTCADASDALSAINAAGITVHEMTNDDDSITIRFRIQRKHLRGLQQIAGKKGYDLKIVDYHGFYWIVRGFSRRPVLMLGLALLLMLSFYIPSRVLFVSVQGNVTVPTRLILEKSEQCGLRFGASRRAVRSEQIKNALLEAIPELQWAGINTYGCTAVISVRERSEEQQDERPDTEFSSITALRDGVITRCTVTKGTQLCRVGQVVRAGQLLVSGYTDCGICIQAGPSEAEIYAQTQRQLKAITPIDWVRKGESTRQEKKISLIIGKKRINFYKGSGISGSTCDKMYSEYYVTLPGGYILPVSIIAEVSRERACSRVQLTETELQTALAANARYYLLSQMTAGTILTNQETCVAMHGFLVMDGNYACEEMIARIQCEEIEYPDGNDN